MSAILDAVQEAAERREEAQAELPKLMRQAQEAGHSLSEIGRAAGMSKQGARFLIRREEART